MFYAFTVSFSHEQQNLHFEMLHYINFCKEMSGCDTLSSRKYNQCVSLSRLVGTRHNDKYKSELHICQAIITSHTLTTFSFHWFRFRSLFCALQFPVLLCSFLRSVFTLRRLLWLSFLSFFTFPILRLLL